MHKFKYERGVPAGWQGDDKLQCQKIRIWGIGGGQGPDSLCRQKFDILGLGGGEVCSTIKKIVIRGSVFCYWLFYGLGFLQRCLERTASMELS